MIKNIFIIILIVFLALFQIGFLNEFSSISKFSNLLLIFLIFLTFKRQKNIPILYILITGLIMDISSIYFFGFYTIVLLITALAIKYLQTKYINQKTYYGLLIISLLGTFVYFILSLMLINMTYLINFTGYYFQLDLNLLVNLIIQLIVNSSILICVLFITRFFTNQFKSKLYLRN